MELTWNGRVGARPAPEGSYLVRLGDGALSSSADPDPEEAFEFRHHVFPIVGKHDLGRNPANTFGGGRGHQGQDMFANCGTPVRAAQGGEVDYAGYHSAAGNYIVIRGAGSGEDYVYMHLRDSSSLKKGDTVKTGKRIGQRRPDRPRRRLPPALRAVVQARLVQGRQRLRPAPQAEGMGRLVVGLDAPAGGARCYLPTRRGVEQSGSSSGS